MPTSSSDHQPRPAAHLAVRNLTAGYGGVPVINDISIDAGHGEKVALLGPNGAGKSTFLKALMGMLTIDAGDVHLGDLDVTGMSTDSLARQGVGYVPQTRDVFAKLRVRENLEMGAYLLNAATTRERIEEVVTYFPALGRLLHRPATNLSGGERKMLAIGRVLMMRPTLMVLDEPTAGLSPELSRKLLGEYISGLAADGMTILLVEQKAVAALEMADWAYVLVSGASRLAGPARALLEDDEFGEVFLGKGSAPVGPEVA
jgi:ABC-type branched-subunit amino acid transport system ATPase component